MILNKIADRIEENLESIARRRDVGERQAGPRDARPPTSRSPSTTSATSPACIRAQEGSLSRSSTRTPVAYHFHEPLGVVGQIIPWNFPILMAVWKLAPALAAGNCVVLKPAEQTPASILYLVSSSSATCCPLGVLNIGQRLRHRGGRAARHPASASARSRSPGETTTGRLIMQYASQNLIPVTLELGGKSPNVFFEDVARDTERRLLRQGARGLHALRPQPGRGVHLPVARTRPGRSIYDELPRRRPRPRRKATQGNPLDPETMIGAQASNDQLEKILSLHRDRQAAGAPSCSPVASAPTSAAT